MAGVKLAPSASPPSSASEIRLGPLFPPPTAARATGGNDPRITNATTSRTVFRCATWPSWWLRGAGRYSSDFGRPEVIVQMAPNVRFASAISPSVDGNSSASTAVVTSDGGRVRRGHAHSGNHQGHLQRHHQQQRHRVDGLVGCVVRALSQLRPRLRGGVGAAAAPPQTRPDVSRALPGTDALGVKIRGGSPRFELKLRPRPSSPLTLPGAVPGQLEEWQRWSFFRSGISRFLPRLGLPKERWVEVEKRRRLATIPYRGDAGCRVEITALRTRDQEA